MGSAQAGLMLVIAATTGVIGCQAQESQPAPPPARVRVNVTEPRDGSATRAQRVDVAGTVVPPSATVLVNGELVAPVQGRFSTVVDLDVGGNVIDVLVSSGRRRPAMAALRVTRQVVVRVPDVLGDSADDARETLAGIGLSPVISDDGGLLEDLLPIDAVVCATQPAPGTELRGGSRVDVEISKLC